MSRDPRPATHERSTILFRISIIALCVLAVPAAAQVGSPAGPVPPELLEQRRAALFERIGTGIGIVESAELRSVEGDYPQDSDYRENNGFFFLTGLEAPGGLLVLVARDTAADEAILYLPARRPAAERWTGPRLGPGPEATAITGIQDVRPAGRAEAETRQLLSRPGAPPLVELESHLAALRLVKDADELRRLSRAIGITADALLAAMRELEPGMWEYELEAVIEYGFRRNGAERVGFPSIVGSGPNSTVLHYDKSRRRMEAGDLVVVDVGAEFGYYSADVTRTLPVSGRFTPRQRALYELVLASQQAAIDSARPGTTVQALNRIAREYMRQHSGTLCNTTCDAYFVHGLSHWLGMDVHDVGDYSTPLAPGMVLTVEPGIYLPEEEIGIRIEDDILVTEGAPRILSAGAPRDPEAIERAMAEGRVP